MMTSAVVSKTTAERGGQSDRRWWRSMEADELVRRDVGSATLALPRFLEDVTVYRFRDRNDADHELRASRLPASKSDLDAVIGRRRRELRAAFQPFGSASAISSLPEARFSNRYFCLEARLGMNLALHVAAVVAWDELLLLEYDARERNDAVFSSVLRSLTAAPSRGAVEPGFARRSYGGYRLDVPAALAPPSQYAFEGRGLRLVADRGELELTRDDVAFELGAEPGDELLVTDSPPLELAWDDFCANQRGFSVQLRDPERGAPQHFRVARVTRQGELVLSLLAQAGPGAPELDPLLRSTLLGIR